MAIVNLSNQNMPKLPGYLKMKTQISNWPRLMPQLSQNLRKNTKYKDSLPSNSSRKGRQLNSVVRNMFYIVLFHFLKIYLRSFIDENKQQERFLNKRATGIRSKFFQRGVKF